MINAFIIIILIAIVGGASYYIYKQKKNGVKCIGCSSGSKCSGNCACCGRGDTSRGDD